MKTRIIFIHSMKYCFSLSFEKETIEMIVECGLPLHIECRSRKNLAVHENGNMRKIIMEYMVFSETLDLQKLGNVFKEKAPYFNIEHTIKGELSKNGRFKNNNTCLTVLDENTDGEYEEMVAKFLSVYKHQFISGH